MNACMSLEGLRAKNDCVCIHAARRAANPAARVTWQPDRLAVKLAGLPGWGTSAPV